MTTTGFLQLFYTSSGFRRAKIERDLERESKREKERDIKGKKINKLYIKKFKKIKIL